MHIEWNDLQTIEALVRTGTIEAAARALDLTHPTISRRLAAIEARLSTSLFVRGARLQPTALARQIAEQATSMQRSATAVADLVAGEQRRRDGRLVITTNDVLAPLLFRALHALTANAAPLGAALDVEVVVGDAELALDPGRIDLALRPAHDPADALRGRRLGQLRLGLFVAVGSTLDRHWVVPDAALRARRSMRWWRHVPDDADHVVTCNTLLGIRDACAAGLGRAILPTFLFDGDARVRLLRPIDDGPPVWLLSPSSSSSKHARATRAAVAAALLAVKGAFVAR